MRNEITLTNVKVKNLCFSYFEKNKQKSSEILKGLRSLVNINKFKSSSINLLNENGDLVSDPKKISNVFNQFFSTIGHEIEKKIPIAPGSFIKDYFNKKDESFIDKSF